MMNKKDWETALENLIKIRANAEDNRVKAEKDLEEIDFMVQHYNKKISEFK